MRKPTLIPSLESYWKKYEQLQDEMRPLEIIAEVLSPVAGYDNTMFDGLLARLVVDEATNGNLLDGKHSPYLLPTPLKPVWFSEIGLPLWAANALGPISSNQHITIWWHKRFIKEDHVELRKGIKKSAISKVKGRYKEKRTPMPAQTASEWRTTCIGHKEEIVRLLQKCAAFGKKRNAIIRRWLIRDIEHFRFNRPVPVQYIYEDKVFPLNMAQKSWTPPYWVGVPETRSWCVVPEIDYFLETIV